jgi:hypothetical protein
VGPLEYVNEFSSVIKGGKIPDYLSDCQFLEKSCFPWSYLSAYVGYHNQKLLQTQKRGGPSNCEWPSDKQTCAVVAACVALSKGCDRE